MKKCSQCGTDNLRNIPIPFEVSGDASLNICMYIDGKRFYPKLQTLICMDCGHIEWFSDDIVNAIKDNDFKISQLKIELETLEKRLSEAQEKLSLIEDEISKSKVKALSLDITIREQQDLNKTISKLDDERYEIKREIRSIEQSIQSSKSALSKLKLN